MLKSNKRKRSYSGATARATIRVYKAAKRSSVHTSPTGPDPVSAAKAASGGASRATIYRWLKANMSDSSIYKRLKNRGRHRKLSDDLEALAIGFVIDLRLNFVAVDRKKVQEFIGSFLKKKVSLEYITKLLRKYGITEQSGLGRNSRMISPEVVDDAINFITELREESWSPKNILVMDETGIWSNSVRNRTFHFSNWYDFYFDLIKTLIISVWMVMKDLKIRSCLSVLPTK